MAARPKFAQWLTRSRLRAHGILLATCLWTLYAVDLSTPGFEDRNGLIKGTDFLHFYTLGSMALGGQGEGLYNMDAQTALLQHLVPDAAGYSYVALYGPQVSLLFAPFALLPYGWALLAWLLLNTALYGSCCYLLWRTCEHLRHEAWTVAVLALAFPGFFHLVTWGQTSGLALVCFTLAYLALRKQHPLLAGLAIGCLIYKPQLGLAAAVVFIFSREWKVVAGAVVSAVLEVAIGWLYYGTPVMRNYLVALTQVRDVLTPLEPRPYQMHSLRGFWALLIPSAMVWVCYLLSSAAVLTLAVWCWRRSRLPIGYSAVLLATVLVSPHLTVYDLIILAPAFLFLADWTICRETALASWVQVFLYLCYLLFLVGPLTRVIRLQFSVPVMAALLWTCYLMVRRPEEGAVASP